ncbi:unnamed protein product [Macrosiphum euphorbiae]|uniref:Uncharacterized protein n=1 Tax=Macrosiphum euphorbiae TaxID=13131 RepID=A0AAV0X0P2_9HEMI|nr:unnamed protein product [Macrosiphum euphorbiae]
MRKCIVCGNTSNNTNVNRQGESPRRSSRLTRNNEDMSNKNMLIAEKRELVLQLRKTMAETKRNRQHRLHRLRTIQNLIIIFFYYNLYS